MCQQIYQICLHLYSFGKAQKHEWPFSYTAVVFSMMLQHAQSQIHNILLLACNWIKMQGK